MNNSFINYEDKLDQIILSIKEKNNNLRVINNIKKIKTNEDKEIINEEILNETETTTVIEKTDRTKDYFCKQ